MATIGRNHAVIELKKPRFGGFPAWAVWLFVHLMSIVGVENRLFIFMDWMWSYFTYDPSLRTIIKPLKREQTFIRSYLLRIHTNSKRRTIMLKRFLLPVKPDGTFISVILLIVRVVFGVMLMNHGIDKWANYQEPSTVLPDPLGIGSPLSLGLAIFGELACSMTLIIGFLHRLAMILMIFTMRVAFFIVHASDPFAVKEPVSVYLMVFMLMYIVGPNKFAINRWISKSLFRK